MTRIISDIRLLEIADPASNKLEFGPWNDNDHFFINNKATGIDRPSEFIINITWEDNVSNAPEGFKYGVQRAIDCITSRFINPITLNLTIGYGNVNGNVLSDTTLGLSQICMSSYLWTQIFNSLTMGSKTTTEIDAIKHLSEIRPVLPTNILWLTQLQAKALHLYPSRRTVTDGWIGFSSILPFSYSNLDSVDNYYVEPNTYDFVSVCLYEISEVMGRIRFIGENVNESPGYSLLDLFSFVAPNLRIFEQGGYFSIDNGYTSLGTWNTIGKAADWNSSINNDVFNSIIDIGVPHRLSTTDLAMLDIIGYDPIGTAIELPLPPTKIGVSLITSSLQTLQTECLPNTIALNTPVAIITQVDGKEGHLFSYELEPSDDSIYFSITHNGRLSTSSNMITGGKKGTLYSISVIVTDKDTTLSSYPLPINIIVGDNSPYNQMILLDINGIDINAPTIVYGLDNHDTIDGTGMFCDLYFVGGDGIDFMIGGGLSTTYLYSDKGDSHYTCVDVISNFNIYNDKIDLSGLNMSWLSYQGLTDGIIIKSSVAWKIVDHNTMIYVNLSNKTLALDFAPGLIIQLIGEYELTAENFILS